MKKSPILILDISHLAFRMGHAYEELESPDGVSVGAIYGILKELENRCLELKPAYVMACFDNGHAYRTSIFPGYKDRSRGNEEFYSAVIEQIEKIKEIFRIMPFRSVTIHGEEADDLVAHFARAKYFRKYPKVIISGDKDFLQLLNKKTHVLMPRGMITSKNFQESFPVPIDRWLDLRILTGDKSDTIPGVGGIGETYGKEIVEKYDTLENAAAGDGEGLSTRARNLLRRIEERWEVVTLNRKLMDLTARKLKIKLKHVVVGKWNKRAYIKYCRQLGFKSLLRRIPQVSRVMKRIDEYED